MNTFVNDFVNLFYEKFEDDIAENPKITYVLYMYDIVITTIRIKDNNFDYINRKTFYIGFEILLKTLNMEKELFNKFKNGMMDVLKLIVVGEEYYYHPKRDILTKVEELMSLLVSLNVPSLKRTDSLYINLNNTLYDNCNDDEILTYKICSLLSNAEVEFEFEKVKEIIEQRKRVFYIDKEEYETLWKK